MVDPTPEVQRHNFDPHSVPAHAADFFHSARFASQIAGFLGHLVKEDDRRMKDENENLRKATSGAV